MKLEMKVIALFLMFLSPSVVKTSEEKIVYEYKQHEVVDLGELEIKGDVLAPSDLSIEERGRKIFQRPLFDKPNFQQEMRFTILNLR
ncbi:MAG: hypothetical protein QE271_04465 [Bacteriovoracaceae bacterium]|nr:hypothetical protein [Bacteriovoracaceae bacterium]